ncbi:MAG: hypothetical protein O7A06_05915, partial [Acidobacteria bacterium]|nr:hypothetical protein [Acidobacteriota bacterium]
LFAARLYDGIHRHLQPLPSQPFLAASRKPPAMGIGSSIRNGNKTPLDSEPNYYRGLNGPASNVKLRWRV